VPRYIYQEIRRSVRDKAEIIRISCVFLPVRCASNDLTMRTTLKFAAFATVFVPVAAVLAAGSGVFDLEIGDSERKGRHAPVVLDGITDTGTGDLLTPGELAERLADTRILFIGEDHTDMDFHRVQVRVLEELHRAGREVMVGLEMYPYTRQESLDEWSEGSLTEEEFVESSGWYESWGYRWDYYRRIFLFARDNGIPMFGVNIPRDHVRTVRTEGFEGLSAEQAAHMPERVDTDSDEHRQLFRAYFEDDDAVHAAISAEQWDGMFRAQCTWDAAMGWNAQMALEQHGGEDAIMVVLIGAGHVTYGLGAERQIEDAFAGRITSLVPVPIRDGDNEPVHQVRASYADFVWGVPPETAPAYPSLGVSLMGAVGSSPTQVIQVSDDSVAQRAGIKVGDVLLQLDRSELDSIVSLSKLIAGYDWGDSAVLRFERDGEIQTLDLHFRRVPADTHNKRERE